VPLNEIKINKKCIVCSLLATGNERRRLLDLGIIQGTKLEALCKSPSGDPTAYFVRGIVIALRSECARNIIVKSLN
jgi:Fe2+ transport system protein A